MSSRDRRVLTAACVMVAFALVASAKDAHADAIAGADPAAETSERVVTGDEGEAPPTEPDAQPAPPVRRKVFVRGHALAGYSDGGVFGIQSRSFHAGAGIDLHVGESLALPIGVDVDFGESRGGLSTGKVAVSGAVQGIIGRFRLGIGVELAHVWLSRPNTDRTIGAIGAGPFALATFDVVDFGQSRALFVGVRPTVGWLWGIEDALAVDRGAVAWRVAAVAGARF